MAGELTYRRLLNYLKILEADDSPMLDLKVQIKDDDTGEIAHAACVMVTNYPNHQPYLLTCADPQEWDEDDDDTEDYDGPDDEESTYESELNRTPWTAYKSPNRW
jgi:hypothetical protein